MAAQHAIAMDVCYSYFAIERPVVPNGGERSDVALVQFLIAKFYLFETGPTRGAFFSVYDAAMSSGHRWDDGFYGEYTRKAVSLFEEAAGAPVKDGIFRPGNPRSIAGAYAGCVAKVDKLNWVFDRYFSSDLDEKDRNIRLTANPILGRRLLGEE